MKTFRSSVDYPSPFYLPFGKQEDDVAAVIAGVKPCASVVAFAHPFSPLMQILFKRANNKEGLIIRSSSKHIVAVGLYLHVIEITNMIKNRNKMKSENDRIGYCVRIGELLGYCQEAIDDFTYGLVNNLDFEQRRLRRLLLKAG